MARFNISILCTLLVLAVVALSMPVKRGGDALPLNLDGTLDQLKSATRLMDGLDRKESNNKDNQEQHDEAAAKAQKKKDEEAQKKKDEAETMAKVNKKLEEAKNGDNAAPTPTASHKNKLSSGTFVTPTSTPTHKAKSEPNALGKIPLIGGLLGGAGAGL
ncbi:uncharacterized protein N7515_002869 [Penicillium bovifimosum]|uniref:Uncharacterized protein n=1 Tax=Penicillium bovifimosum TaxID=126998 RepID=A0A9W9HCI3_9EURO|nr:uncharacterized protein N7515_002869 [Penicillium bovifimosum]KAJ5144082.1 hypothetical protein N7515_002869 [Penicillium bovifimosum]